MSKENFLIPLNCQVSVFEYNPKTDDYITESYTVILKKVSKRAILIQEWQEDWKVFECWIPKRFIKRILKIGKCYAIEVEKEKYCHFYNYEVKNALGLCNCTFLHIQTDFCKEKYLFQCRECNNEELEKLLEEFE
jgi:hypothetical protein